MNVDQVTCARTYALSHLYILQILMRVSLSIRTCMYYVLVVPRLSIVLFWRTNSAKKHSTELCVIRPDSIDDFPRERGGKIPERSAA